MTNIIQFPKNNTNPHSIEQNSPELIEEVRRQFCDEVVADVMEAASGIFASYGIVSKGDVYAIKDVVFLEEALKAMIYRFKNLDHNLHPIIEQVITVSPEIEKELQDKFPDLQDS